MKEPRNESSAALCVSEGAPAWRCRMRGCASGNEELAEDVVDHAGDYGPSSNILAPYELPEVLLALLLDFCEFRGGLPIAYVPELRADRDFCVVSERPEEAELLHISVKPFGERMVDPAFPVLLGLKPELVSLGRELRGIYVEIRAEMVAAGAGER